jgi:hypothetical protein
MTGRGTTRRLKIDLQFIGFCVCETSHNPHSKDIDISPALIRHIPHYPSQTQYWQKSVIAKPHHVAIHSQVAGWQPRGRQSE